MERTVISALLTFIARVPQLPFTTWGWAESRSGFPSTWRRGRLILHLSADLGLNIVITTERRKGILPSFKTQGKENTEEKYILSINMAEFIMVASTYLGCK